MDFFLRGLQAVIGSSALGDIGGSLVLLSGEAELPARLFGAALLLAFLKGGDTVRVLLAGSPLLGTFFLDAFLSVSQDDSGGLVVVLFLDDGGSVEAVVFHNASHVL